MKRSRMELHLETIRECETLNDLLSCLTPFELGTDNAFMEEIATYVMRRLPSLMAAEGAFSAAQLPEKLDGMWAGIQMIQDKIEETLDNTHLRHTCANDLLGATAFFYAHWGRAENINILDDCVQEVLRRVREEDEGAVRCAVGVAYAALVAPLAPELTKELCTAIVGLLHIDKPEFHSLLLGLRLHSLVPMFHKEVASMLVTAFHKEAAGMLRTMYRLLPTCCAVSDDAPEWAWSATLTGASMVMIKRNQDAVLSIPLPPTDAVLFAVFDGHGPFGEQVSAAARRALAHVVRTYVVSMPDVDAPAHDATLADFGVTNKCFSAWSLPWAAIVRQVDAALLSSDLDTSLSGCTLCAAVVNRFGKGEICNLGDSRAVLGGGMPRPVARLQTADHKPDGATELHRIKTMNGLVAKTPHGTTGHFPGATLERMPERLWSRRGAFSLKPGLAVARGLGDAIAQSCGLSIIPDVFPFAACPGDRLIVGSDGVWDVMSATEALQQPSPESIVSVCRERWGDKSEGSYRDDISVIILGPFAEKSKI
eukprot:GEMP01029163.1.p1 GENE.GEMP01029163.1~~GEMP01029163.1.p1  ORF type:complete len:538 (+),score=92.40 GEMP01029163.1:412-2025(+)